MPSVNVVSQHDHEIKTDDVVEGIHLLCNFVLFFLAGPAISDDSKTHRLVLERYPDIKVGFGLTLGEKRAKRDQDSQYARCESMAHFEMSGRAFGTYSTTMFASLSSTISS